MPERAHTLVFNRTIAIVTDEPGWHGRRLRAALAARGYESNFISLTDCSLAIGGQSELVQLPGFEARKPAGVFVRGVPGGTLEQVIQRLNILHALDLFGVPVYNRPAAIERTVDKAMTSLRLHLAGIPTPRTWVCEATEQARQIVRAETAAGRPVVMKPLFGSQGTGVIRVDHIDAMPDVDEFKGVWYLQTLIDRPQGDWRDYRVLIIDGRACAAMVRHNDFWITNRAQGGRCEAIVPGARLTLLAQAAAEAVDIDYAGVDLLESRDGDFLVTEVNSIPAWQGLQGVCKLDIAQLLVDDFLSRMSVAAHRLEAVP